MPDSDKGAIQPAGEKPSAGGTWTRVTAGCHRIDGHWLVIHEHVSVPIDPEAGQGGRRGEVRTPHSLPTHRRRQRPP